MEHRIETIKSKKLVVLSQKMSIAENKTLVLWNSFMKRKAEIKDAISSDFYSIQVYEKNYFDTFNPNLEFIKRAGEEVDSFENCPEGFERFTIEEGKYAVFQYKGNPNNGREAFQYIFQEWLPNSGFSLDYRPHFEILGEKYKNNSKDSEEEIWTPIK